MNAGAVQSQKLEQKPFTNECMHRVIQPFSCITKAYACVETVEWHYRQFKWWKLMPRNIRDRCLLKDEKRTNKYVWKGGKILGRKYGWDLWAKHVRGFQMSERNKGLRFLGTSGSLGKTISKQQQPPSSNEQKGATDKCGKWMGLSITEENTKQIV